MSSIVHLSPTLLCRNTSPYDMGAIPASRYKLSILLGCRHPVMERQSSFYTGLTVCAYDDLSHTGNTYSTLELLSASDVVLMVDEFALHFKLESFFITLFLTSVFALTFAM